ncbi:hypothetical protein TNCV_210891 [Trichonephila clavipes]|uniref:Uncharacterized protein n=1 Tax=Trichonephila clavipes TaxID=2585209 RepID=A0A8X6T3B4_TRICX|nr:hypothetical protein TNCV_210891 [Trichonephila clavipes]
MTSTCPWTSLVTSIEVVVHYFRITLLALIKMQRMLYKIWWLKYGVNESQRLPAKNSLKNSHARLTGSRPQEHDDVATSLNQSLEIGFFATQELMQPTQ